MPKIPLVVILLTYFFNVSQVQAQSPDQVLSIADELYDNGKYFGSIGFYEKAMKIDSTDAEVLYKYGRNLAAINQAEKASRYLLKSSLLNGDDRFSDLYFELAQAYHQSGDYRRARRYYNRAIRPYRRDRKSPMYRKIDQAKDGATWAMKNDDKNSNQPENLGTTSNSNFSDFAARAYNGKLFFTAMIADSVINHRRIEDENYYARIYAKVKESEESANKLEFEEENLSLIKNRHLANLSLYHDSIAFFSVCDTNFNCEIWTAELFGKLLISPKKLNSNINFPGANNTQAEVVDIDDETLIYFVSDRSKGFGGLDIWMSRKEDYGFGEPINLGATVNTPGNEITPSYSEIDQSLYFSSDWHYGFGGYDVFKSKGSKSKFEEAENLKMDINSNQNDYYFFPYSANSALLTSDRKEGNSERSNSCCNDLYQVEYNRQPIEENQEGVEEVPEVSVSLLNKYLPLELYFHNDVPNPNSRDTTTKANYRDLAYQFIAMEGEYLDKNQGYTMDDEQQDQLADFFEEEVESGIKDLEFFTPLLLEELKKGSKIDLNIKGYASSVSEADYNFKLTLRRIESLVNYLRSYNNGVFIPYLNQTADNGGQLAINKIPYGDFANELKLDANDKVKAIYSLAAAKQRKIEIIAVTESKEGYKRMDDQSLVQYPKAKFNSTSYKLGKIKQGTTVNRTFLLENTGSENLLIYNLSANCNCVSVQFPKEVKAGEKSAIKVELATSELVLGENKVVLTMISNALKNIQDLSLEVTIEK